MAKPSGWVSRVDFYGCLPVEVFSLVESLVRKHRKFSVELQERKEHCERLSLSCDEEDMERWENDRLRLESKRVQDPYFADEFWADVVDQGAELYKQSIFRLNTTQALNRKKSRHGFWRMKANTFLGAPWFVR